MPAPFLPSEVTQLILAQVSSNHYWDGETRSKTLAVCCRISRMFLEPARLALYTHLEVQLSKRETAPDGHVIDYWHTKMDSPTAKEEAIVQTDSRELERTLLVYPHLGTLVRTLQITSGVHNSEYLRPRMVSHILAVILRCCTNIDDLRIAERTDSGMTANLEVVSLLNPHLRKLSLASWDDISGASRKVLSKSGLAAVKHLDLRVLSSQLFPQPDDLPYSFRLESLVLEVAAGCAHETVPRMLSHLAPSSASSLKTLHVGIDSPTIDLSPFTQLDTLTFLFKMSQKRPYLNQARIVAEALALSLRRAGSPILHLTLAALSCSEYEFQATIIDQVLPLLPTSLETLDISSYELSAAPLLTFLNPANSPTLRRLVLYKIAPDTSEGIRRWEDLDRVCAARMKEVVQAGATRDITVEVLSQDRWDERGSRRNG